MAKGLETEAEVKAWLKTQLRGPDVFETVWEDDTVQECVVCYFQGRGGDRGELLSDIESAARRVLSIVRKATKEREGRQAGISQRVRLPGPDLDAYQQGRAEAFAAFAAREAARHPDVRAFRRDVLDDRLLTRQEVDDFVQSIVLSLASLEQCKAWGIPPGGHTERRTGGGYGEGSLEYHIDPPGTTIRLDVPGGFDLIDPPTLAYPVERETGDAPIWTYPGSVLDTLRVLCEELARSFGWEIPAVVRFVLTGERPPCEPVRSSATVTMMGSHRRVGITLQLDAWLSDDEVTRAYREARDELGVPKNVPVKERTLRLFRFVTERTDDAGRRPSWRELCDEWNRAEPDAQSRYVSYFERDYERGMQHVLYPTCRFFKILDAQADREDTDEPDA